MLSSQWHKIFNDLLGNKTRTALIVLSIAVGLFAVGAIVSSQSILETEMARSFAAINPSSGTVRTLQPFDQDFVQSVRAMPEVQDADARRAVYARIKVGSGEWRNITIFALDDYDYDAIRVNKIWPQSGAWPPPERAVLIERAALPVIGAQVGDRVLVETSNLQQREMVIAGTVHDPAQMPAQFDNSPYGYISFETLEWFGEPFGFNELYVVATRSWDKEHTQAVVNQVKSKAERNGLIIPLVLTAEPGQLPLDDILQAVLLLLGALGMLSLFLSVFLILNTISALLTQQKRQIGIMKAIGARTGQIVGMYLAMVCIYGLLALSIAVPLSLAGSQALSRFMAAMFNFDLVEPHAPPQAILLQFAVGLLVPVMASLYPFVANLRITPSEAMSAYSTGRGRFGAGLLDRLLSGANLWFARRVLMRPLVLSLRNTFRNKGRLALTLVTLTLGGAIFVSVFSLQASLDRTVDDLMQSWNFDTMINFSQPYRIERIEHEARQVPGVADTDVWLQLAVRRVRPDGSEGSMVYLFAPRADSKLSPPPAMVQGRWLLPEDENAVVVNAIMLKEEADLRLGDEIVLKLQGKERRWRIVGVCMGVMFPMAYANYPYVARVTGNAGTADAALVSIVHNDETSVMRTSAALEARFKDQGLSVSNVQTAGAERAEAQVTFGVIVSLLLIMAVLLAIVGGLGLMGTMSINVLERTREIGVLRAIGAPNLGVAQVFILEGVGIGVLSWAFGSVLALPLGKLLSDAIGVPLMGTPLSFAFSTAGVWAWLAVVVALSALASFLPARGASRLTVREVLAYE